MNKTGYYIHVPFCVKKCDYCDFCSVGIGSRNRDLIHRMIDALIREINVSRETYNCSTISSVYIGGGTPSVVPAGEMERLLSVIGKPEPEAEFTIECNPGTVDEEKLHLYRAYGVNRLSIGCQSLQNEELARLGRIHTAEDFFRTFESARKEGVEQINVDLMSAIPSQTEETLLDTLLRVIAMEPEHISVYSLIIEPGTVFYDRYHGCSPVDEETDLRFYELTTETLHEAGYLHYEISNYAKRKDCMSVHNLNYWRRGSYIGVGPAAASFDLSAPFGVRKTNTKDLVAYMDSVEKGESPAEEIEQLTKEQAKLEKLYLGLRTGEGIGLDVFSDDSKNRKRQKALIKQWIRDGLAYEKNDRFILTEKGFFVSDSIVELLMD